MAKKSSKSVERFKSYKQLQKQLCNLCRKSVLLNSWTGNALQEAVQLRVSKKKKKLPTYLPYFLWLETGNKPFFWPNCKPRYTLFVFSSDICMGPIHPCENAGTCIRNASDPLGYNCECDIGWTGSNCTESEYKFFSLK